MPRDGQGTTFDAILASDGFDSRELLIITLADGFPVHLSDAEVTIDGQIYQPDIREPGEPRFSQGSNPDGTAWAIQNADGAYSTTDASGVSPLEGAAIVHSRAVAYPGTNVWYTDILMHGKIRNVEADEAQARFQVISDMSDPSAVMSGESIVVEELTPIAAVTTGGLDGDGGGGRTGWEDRDGFFDPRRGRMGHLLDYDYRPAF